MNCARFTRILAEFQEGKLPEGERAAAEGHLEKCPSCRRLLEVAEGRVDILPTEIREGLALSILERTSGGPACRRAEPLLWEYSRGELSAEDSQLTSVHLNHCPGCRSVAADIALILETLPAMAEMDPGESFTRDVLRATGGLRLHRPGPGFRLRTWWNRAVQRPRFALESAYVCTLLFLALSPFLPLRQVLLQTIPQKAMGPPAKYAASVWAGAKVPVSRQARYLASALVSTNRDVSGVLERMSERAVRGSASALHRSLQLAGVAQRQGAAAAAACWDRLSGRMPRNSS